MKTNSLVALLLLAASLPAIAAPSNPSKAANDKALQDAFECRGLSSTIEAAMQSRHISTDGETHATLQPPITVLGFKVDDVTVFGEGGEEVFTTYIRAPKAAVEAAVKKARWPGTADLSADAIPGGVTRLACSFYTEPDSDYL